MHPPPRPSHRITPAPDTAANLPMLPPARPRRGSQPCRALAMRIAGGRAAQRSALYALALALLLPGLPAHSEADPPAPATATADDALPLDAIRTFTDVFARIKADYVEQVDDKTLLENAIRGMLSGLDPHSSYLDPEAFEGLQEGTQGEFGGLGIEVGMEDGFVRVIAPIDDTPAAAAGVQAGDLIIRLDDTPVKGMPLGEAVKLMRGKPGTDITLSIVREGEEKPIKLTLTRAVIRVDSVKARIVEPGYAYLRISHFQAHTGEDTVAALKRLQKDSEAPLKGIVLDLRNNPGGILSAAVDVSDAFLEDGLIVYTEGRVEDSELRFNATAPDLTDGANLVVLVNEGSASASEIVAGALQDRQRAVIMGTATFGKGSVQTILPMSNAAALKLTTARYFTPGGRSIQAEGIVPDIVVDRVRVTEIEEAPERVREANLARHLENPGEEAEVLEEAAEVTANAADADEADTARPLAQSDYALYEALNLLKGMALMQARK